MTLSTGFPASAAKFTMEKQGDLCRRVSKNTTGIYDLLAPRPPPFLNRPTRPTTIRFGTRSSLLIETLTGTHVGLIICRIEILEAWMPTLKIHNNRRTVQQRTAEGIATHRNNGTMGGSKCTNHS